MNYRIKSLAYVAAGVGAVILAPATGGTSIAALIGAMGTTTAAGLAIGAGVGATAAAVDSEVQRRKNTREELERAKRQSISMQMVELESMLAFEFD
jgi:hypothetical protein